MPVASFDTPEGEEVEIDSDDVVRIKPAPIRTRQLIELEDGEEIVVVASGWKSLPNSNSIRSR